jgi:hypothetical protein
MRSTVPSHRFDRALRSPSADRCRPSCRPLPRVGNLFGEYPVREGSSRGIGRQLRGRKGQRRGSSANLVAASRNSPKRSPSTETSTSPWCLCGQSCTATTRVSRSGRRRKSWASRGRRPPSCTSRTVAFPAIGSSGEPGTGFKTALATLDHTRPTIGAQAVRIAQGAVDAAIAYTKERKQFGQRVSDFQGVQFMLADMAMKVEAARLMVYSAVARTERGSPT